MSVPGHDPSCKTLVYEARCWHCRRSIYVLHCTCGSTVLFDEIGVPWGRHECAGTRHASSTGRTGLREWAERLREHFVPESIRRMREKRYRRWSRM